MWPGIGFIAVHVLNWDRAPLDSIAFWWESQVGLGSAHTGLCVWLTDGRQGKPTLLSQDKLFVVIIIDCIDKIFYCSWSTSIVINKQKLSKIQSGFYYRRIFIKLSVESIIAFHSVDKKTFFLNICSFQQFNISNFLYWYTCNIIVFW